MLAPPTFNNLGIRYKELYSATLIGTTAKLREHSGRSLSMSSSVTRDCAIVSRTISALRDEEGWFFVRKCISGGVKLPQRHVVWPQ